VGGVASAERGGTREGGCMVCGGGIFSEEFCKFSGISLGRCRAGVYGCFIILVAVQCAGRSSEKIIFSSNEFDKKIASANRDYREKNSYSKFSKIL